MTPIVTIANVPQFDTTLVSKRDLVRAQHKDWEEPRNGLLVDVKPDELAVLWLPGIGVATSYFTVKVEEVVAGDWTTLVTSPDLATFVGGASQ